MKKRPRSPDHYVELRDCDIDHDILDKLWLAEINDDAEEPEADAAEAEALPAEDQQAEDPEALPRRRRGAPR